MSSGNNKPMIEGLTSPAASAVNLRKENGSAGFNLDVMRSLRMRPRLAAGVAAAVFILLVGFALSRKPTYIAYSLTYVEPTSSKVLSDGTAGGFDPARYDSYLQQQMQTALRPDILAAAIGKLPPGIWQHPGEKEQAAVARLRKALKVERVTTSYQLSISLTGPDPDAVAATVNAVTNAYLDQGRKDEHAISSQRLQLLTQERQRIQSDLEQDRVEQAGLSGALGVASPVGELANPYDTQLTGVRTQLAAARAAHDVALAQLASVKRSAGAQTPGLAAAADDLLQGDTGLSSMKATINQRKAVLSSQMAGLTPSNPVYKQDQDEIADLDRSLDKMTTELRDKAEHRVEDKLGLELQRTASVEGMLNSQLAQQTATATGAAPKIQRASELATDITRLTTRFATVDDAIRGLQLEANGPGMAHLSVAAAVPTSPQPSKRKIFLLLSLPLALLFGAGAAVVAHRRDPLVYTESDLLQVLGFPPIGVLPSRDEVSRATIEEYVFRVAAGVETAYRVSSARSFVFTAASPSLVLTGLISILQSKLEELGFTVHVLKANTLLQPGLGGGTVAPSPRQRELPGSGYLALLHDPNHEGFAAANLHELKKNHDLLLIDAPPLLHSAATEYAVRCADATILVAGSAVTQREELTQSAILLDRLNVAGVGAVLKDLLLKHADPSFKTAIEVLESRWSAEAMEASRASRAARAAYHTTRTSQTTHEKVDEPVTTDSSDLQVSDPPLEAVQPASTVDADEREHDGDSTEAWIHDVEESRGRITDPIAEPLAEPLTEAAQGHHPRPTGAHELAPTDADPNAHLEDEQSPDLASESFAEASAPTPLGVEGMREEMVASEPDLSAVSMPPTPEEPVPPVETHSPQFTPSPRSEDVVQLSDEEREMETSERAKVWLQRLLNPGIVPEPAGAQQGMPDEEEVDAALERQVEPEEIFAEDTSFGSHQEEGEPVAAVEASSVEPHRDHPQSEHVSFEVGEHAFRPSIPESRIEPEPAQAARHYTAAETHEVAATTSQVIDRGEDELAPPAGSSEYLHVEDAVDPAPLLTSHPVSANFGAVTEDLQEPDRTGLLDETKEGIFVSVEVAEHEGDHLVEEPAEEPVDSFVTHEFHHEPQATREDGPTGPLEEVNVAMTSFEADEPGAQGSQVASTQSRPVDVHEIPPAAPAHEATDAAEDVGTIVHAEPVVMMDSVSAEVQQVQQEVKEPMDVAPPAPWETGRTARLEQAASLAGPPRDTRSATDPHVPLRATFSGVRRAAALRAGKDPAVSVSTHLAGRTEGSIEPETGRMTRSWGMLSRFGVLLPVEPTATESLEDQTGQ